MLGEVGLKLNRKNFYLVYDVCSELDFLKGNTEHLQNQKKIRVAIAGGAK